jgi:hypothetical protein
LDVKNILLETISHHILPQMLISPHFNETSDLLKESIKFATTRLYFGRKEPRFSPSSDQALEKGKAEPSTSPFLINYKGPLELRNLVKLTKPTDNFLLAFHLNLGTTFHLLSNKALERKENHSYRT